MNVTVLLICSLQKNICSGSYIVNPKKKKKKSLPTYPSLKVRTGERGNKHFFNCGLTVLGGRCLSVLSVLDFYFLQDIAGVIIGGYIEHFICTGITVLGGRCLSVLSVLYFYFYRI
jgi:hypothetical protein